MILHNASVCAVQPFRHERTHDVTKAALMMVSRPRATEVVADGIRVNRIAIPGGCAPWPGYMID